MFFLHTLPLYQGLTYYLYLHTSYYPPHSHPHTPTHTHTPHTHTHTHTNAKSRVRQKKPNRTDNNVNVLYYNIVANDLVLLIVILIHFGCFVLNYLCPIPQYRILSFLAKNG